MIEFWNKNKGIILWLTFLFIFVLIVYFINKNNIMNVAIHNDSNYFRKTDINEVIPIYVTEEEIAKRYLSEYVNLIIYHPEKAFELLDEECLINKFDSYESFKEYRSSIMTDNFVRIVVNGYSYKIENGKRAMHVKDADDNEFIFRENSLMDYTVIIK